MCGFIGNVSNSRVDINALVETNHLITCRGPDETKNLDINTKEFFGIQDINLQLIFNRLSIIDLSPKASQPMVSKEHKTISMFNGEIYNHRELRKELIKDGETFESNHSDSEVVLLGLSRYGMSYINKLNGQFAIFFIDTKKSKAFLIRDRLGQKPIFYHLLGDKLQFSSNLLSLLKINQHQTLDEKQIYNYLNLGVVPSPSTLFKNYFKVKPGTFLEIDLNVNIYKSKETKYWDIEEKHSSKKFDVEEFMNLFSDSVTKRMESDVDVANFLSGGIDSTSIIKMLSEKDHPVNSFSVSYEDDRYDESYWFNQVVDKYNLNHQTQKLTKDDLNGDIESAINAFDEPYADPSIVPSFTLSRLISENYKVAISGDGGDELLGGYLRLQQLLGRKKYLHPAKYLNNIYPNFLGTGNRFLKNSSNFSEAYSSYFEDINFTKLLGINASNRIFEELIPNTENTYKKTLIADYNLYLTEMMMLKVDRTSMANSLEVRSPFVDHDLVEYTLGTSHEYFDINNPKKILKEFLSEDFNNEFLNRKKMGFVFNLEKWVFNNINTIKDTVHEGDIIRNLNPNIIDRLLINKSRINAQRIWKIFILEKYLSRL
jgi:asparagine synthase (glutamine-hydrolysing)